MAKQTRLACFTTLRTLFVLVLLIGLATGLSFAGTYTLSVSAQSNRSSASALNGATVSGSIYVFTSLATNVATTNPTGIARVCYSLDSVATRCEGFAPYDYDGSNESYGTAMPWDTTKVASGNHTISQVVTMSTGATESSSATFTVGGGASAVNISVSPSSATVQTGKTQQFTSTISGTTNTGVYWQVNGVGGGNATAGTISGNGLYTAPATAPAGGVSIKALAAADTSKVATATVAVTAPTPSTTTYAIAVSTQANRSGAVALNGATISGTEYIFTAMSSQLSNASPTGITSVCYWLDNPSMSTSARRCEGVSPYDFAGTNDSTSPSTGIGWSTGSVAGGTHTITQKVTTTAGTTEVSTSTFTVQTSALALTTSSLASAGINQSYSATLSATGGSSPYTWSIISGSLNAGISLSTNGVISGTPTTAGTNSFTVQVKDSGTSQQAATANLSLTVANLPPSVATTGLPIATLKASYSTALAGKGGTTPYNWTITSGALPGGLSLSTAGAISGTPTVAGTFPVTVKLTDAAGLTSSANLNLTVSDTTTTGFKKYYASTSFWNTPIPATAATDPNSASMMQQSVLNWKSQHITFSNGGYGMPIAYAKSTDKVYNVKCTGTETTTCKVGSTVAFPIPAGAVIASGTDHHLVVVYEAQDGSPYAGKELDMWLASYDSASDTWSGNGVAINNLYGWGAGCALGQSCENSNVAAGFAGLGGAVRPEEIAQGHIDHALAMATPYNRTGTYFACPATHMDSIQGSSTALPQGAQLQLDPTFNVDAQSWPQWVKVIAKAMQTYGVYNRDFSGVVVLYGVTDKNAGVPSWSSVGVPTDSYGALDVIPWDKVRVINMTACHY